MSKPFVLYCIVLYCVEVCYQNVLWGRFPTPSYLARRINNILQYLVINNSNSIVACF